MGNTILLADKSITIQKIVELTFSDENYQIKCVNDGQSALDAIPQIQPCILLADVSLPVKSGYDVCKALRTVPALSAYSGTPVILLAGIYETMDDERARQVELRVKEVGASALLSKPFDTQLLLSKVKELTGGAAPAQPPAAEEPTSPGNFFSDISAATDDIFSKPADQAPPAMPGFSFAERPPDDSENTMMLPNPISYAGNMFAPTPPPVEEMKPEIRKPVDVRAVTPESEPVFEMDDLANAPEEMAPVEPEPEVESLPEPGSAFTGREEVEFAVESAEVTPVPFSARPMPESIPFVQESPFGNEPEPAPPVNQAQPQQTSGGFIPVPDEPFGDVFGETPAQPSWAGSTTSEEDNPFGVPEPPPAPEPPAPEPEPQTVSMQTPAAIPIEDPWAATPQRLTEPVLSEEPEPAQLEEESDNVAQENTAFSEIKPDFGEDTWSRARASAEGQSVEELFDAEQTQSPAVSEEVEELQPDLSESENVPEPISEPVRESMPAEPARPAPAGQTVEVTDDLIDRIAAKVVAKLSERIVSEIVWQVVPDLAEKMIRRELEKLNAGEE